MRSTAIPAVGNNAFGSQALLSNTLAREMSPLVPRRSKVLQVEKQYSSRQRQSPQVQGRELQYGDRATRFGPHPGDQNTALGFFAGWNLNDAAIITSTSATRACSDRPESNTIRIGTQRDADKVEIHPSKTHAGQERIYIAGISGAVEKGRAVKINTNGRLGTAPSSGVSRSRSSRWTRQAKQSSPSNPLRSVTRRKLTPSVSAIRTRGRGSRKVNPDLVVRDADGKPYTVRYEAVNAMLLNEFLKEHRKCRNSSRRLRCLGRN